MRYLETKAKTYYKLLKYKGCEVFDDKVKYIFVDDAGNEWVHYQINVERCESEAASKRAKQFHTKASNLKCGQRCYCKCTIRREAGAHTYRNVDLIMNYWDRYLK